ncbi:ankyrin [Mollisia scopiformis]|uniref:Ankyrin n=1 Tax=Mollisia scopiformis TaxID=149040 RepID=A0A194XIW9_MOLSC|nr:ankyrin [Mollisia scopiformis]KUJ20059.1 ankyrin [Mollisia scopiformis]
MDLASTSPQSSLATSSPADPCPIDINAKPAELVSTKRKYDAFGETFKHDKVENEKKVIGRPKNAWSSSRSRKLVRLYLMTSLNVDEIVEVLRTEDFMPCKRDVQKQLQSLLQTRPSKIRSRGVMTKVRHQVLRDCRALNAGGPLQVFPEPGSTANCDPNVHQAEGQMPTKPETSFISSDFHPPDLTTSSTMTNIREEFPFLIPLVSANGLLLRSDLLLRQPFRASILSTDNLRKRLAPKTESFIGDVISVLQNYTISESTYIPRTVDSQRSWTASFSSSSLDIYSRNIRLHTQAPFISQEKVLLEHGLLLPGRLRDFEPVHPNRTSIWGRAKESIETSNFAPRDSVSTFIGVSGNQSIKSSHDDSFGHNALHIAAASGQRSKYLLNLIDRGIDFRARNSAGETFLHLVKNIASGDFVYLDALLLRLQLEGFDFSCRDDHGQTPLHNLTRQWLDKEAFCGIAKTLLSYEIDLPRSRDNLGRTILGQMIDVGLEIRALQMLQEQDRSRDSAENNKIQAQENETGHSHYDAHKGSVSNYGTPTLFEPQGDIQLYEIHADLLRTILRANTSPHYEDDQGRNGLHCLAAVCLTLPIPYPLPSSKSNEQTRREAYLSDLLAAGVDPDNCDNAGNTPLMAFITHNQDHDATTVKILSRLHDAGVNLNRRDRAGQTPLHLSVSLGRTAVTSFLLAQGANVHARDSKGRSIIALGMAKSRKALSDAKLYAQIMMCISFVVDAAGVSAPTILQEWALK